MDDGRKTIFRWLASGETGHASATGTPLYHGPGRGAAYSITTLLNAHQLTGESVYLVKAEQLVRRCIHPRDDLEARNLLDAERRWYYTVFLQALGRYLDHKADRRQLDFMYAYARESLLRYARWMLPHEYPYLDKPEILEYPTETWAALDMRKSEVFKFAAKHSEGAERSQFLERSEFFFRYSTRTLSSMKTGTLARPVVLLLSNGYMHSWFHAHPTARAFPPSRADHDFGVPEVFVPQRVRARARLARMVVVVATLVGLLGARMVIWLVFRI
jgi:hypothetical protein